MRAALVLLVLLIAAAPLSAEDPPRPRIDKKVIPKGTGWRCHQERLKHLDDADGKAHLECFRTLKECAEAYGRTRSAPPKEGKQACRHRRKLAYVYTDDDRYYAWGTRDICETFHPRNGTASRCTALK